MRIPWIFQEWHGERYSILDSYKIYGIATPACGLVRNDAFFGRDCYTNDASILERRGADTKRTERRAAKRLPFGFFMLGDSKVEAQLRLRLRKER